MNHGLLALTLCICGLSSVVIGAGVRLTTYDAVIAAAKSGAMIRMINEYGLCDYPGGQAGPNATGGTNVGTFEFFNDPRFGPTQWLSFSASELIKNYQGKGYVFDFVRSRVFPNGSVQTEAQYIEPDYKTVTMDETFH